tara:strand:+ start:891 stop:2033 length:1143 start_codon:yes stop_codon:yes gene_type:complete
MQENNDYLVQWIDEIKVTINDLNAKKSSSDILVFMIGNTSQDIGDGRPYITPIRKISNGFVFGSIVYSQTQAILLSKKIDGHVDYIFVDSEKKLPVNNNPDHSPLEYFEITDSNLDKNRMVEYGNISSVCSNIIQRSHMFTYKGNDITVDATWLFLIERFRELSGMKILIYGAGNIGNKLGLKLVECGCDVIFISRDLLKTEAIIDSLNKIKNCGVISSITASIDPEISSQDVDAIIGCTNTGPVITDKMIENMNNDGVVIDIGKGTIFQSAIDVCNKNGVETWRLDITAIINSLILSSTSMQSVLRSSFGRREIVDSVYVVSGGFIGSKYDIVVDSYLQPKTIFGICESSGKMFFDLDELAKKNLELVEEFIKENNRAK